MLLAVYLLFWHDDRPLEYGQPKSTKLLNGYLQDLETAEQEQAVKEAADQATKGYIDLSEGFEEPLEHTTTWEPYPRPTQDNRLLESSTGSAELEVATTELQPTTTWEPHPELTQDHESMEISTTSAELEVDTTAPVAYKTQVPLQEQFEKELAALEKCAIFMLEFGFC